MPTRAAPRKNQPKAVKRPQGRPKGIPKDPSSGGPPRSQEEVSDLTDEVEHLMLHGFGRAEIGKALGKYLLNKGRGDGKPVPVGTVDDYKARVKRRWEENPILAVEDERDQAIRRYKRRIVQAKTHADSARYEALLAKVTGLEVNTGTLQLVPPAGSPPGTPPTIDVNVTQRPPEAMTSQERRKEIEALEARRRAALAPEVQQAPPAGEEARPAGQPSEDPDPAK